MDIILTLLFGILACFIYNHSKQIQQLYLERTNRAKEIQRLREQLAALQKKIADGLKVQPASSPESSEQAAPGSVSPPVEARGKVEVPETASSIPRPESTPPPVPQPIRLGLDPDASATPARDSVKAQESKLPEPKISRPKIKAPDDGFNWENFLGGKLFAWVGGLSLFIGFAFLLKYSFDRNLISPAVRVFMGFISGVGLVAGGMHLQRKTYAVTSQTLCATGIVILYASSFAAHSTYHLIHASFAFVLMTLITVGAFLLAAGTNAKVIAVLGIAGGFLTPPMLSAGRYEVFALFSYITFLNIGLLCVAFYRKWNFLAVLGVIGTVVLQLDWMSRYFSPQNVLTVVVVFLWFALLFCVSFWYGKKIQQSDDWLTGAAVAMSWVALLIAAYLALNPYTCLRPGVVGICLLGGDLCLLAAVLLERKLQKYHLAAGGFIFIILSLWTMVRMTPELLAWALAGSLLFALLHSAVPMIVERFYPSERVSWQMHLFPLLALLITLIPIVNENGGSWLVWIFVLVFNAGILALSLFTASALAILAALMTTAVLILGWIFNSRAAGGISISVMIILIGAFGIFFSIVSTSVLSRLRQKVSETARTVVEDAPKLFDTSRSGNLFVQIPALSALLPFLLLILASSRITLANPASILGFGCFLAAVTVGLARYLKVPELLPVSMGGVFLLETALHVQHFNSEHSSVFLGFYILIAAVFFSLPFYFHKEYRDSVVPWANAALSGPLHFFLIYDVLEKIHPNNFMGLLPAVMAVPFFFGLTTLLNWIPKSNVRRNAVLAWFGGTTLFFITLIFPIQFDHEWLTISWALEGAALLWLFRKIPHAGLRGVGVALLIVSFCRLALNPTVFLQTSHSAIPILNWYLYTFGIVIVCMFAGGRMLTASQNRALGIPIAPVLYTLGTILAFLLMNIEIADLFSPGLSLKFQFTGDLARGMTYSIAWALFALGLLVKGIRRKLYPVRIAAIGLIGVTLMKLFFFDLNQLQQLYRIGAFVGVAVVLMAASALYQKWIIRKE